MNQQVEDTERDEIFQRLKSSPENNKCFDCDKKNPKWSSVYLGIYVCLDCAGKHREYGPQISFARSLNLDTWNRRYITFMEHGGNAKASEYFKKHGLKTPYDYKNPVIQKYKQELTKKVDAALGATKPQEEVIKSIIAPKVEENKPYHPQHDNMLGHQLGFKSFSDKPTHGEKASDDPFANNITISKDQTKTKGFTVEFNKNKPAFGTTKGRIAAKKIDNVDLDALTLNEDTTTDYSKNSKFDMTDNLMGMTNPNPVTTVKEVRSKETTTTESNEDKFKKFQKAKAISSDAFRDDKPEFGASNVKKFTGASAISSAQFFGEKEEEQDEGEEIDYYQTAENVKDFISKVGGKLRSKADGIVNRLKDDWN